MLRLYHCFTRWSEGGPYEKDALNLSILERILIDGILCTHEQFRLDCDPDTDRPQKAALNKTFPETAVYTIDQSRACFTLLQRAELFEKVGRADFAGGGDQRSHIDLFGEVAIGIDPIEARQFGVLPTSYCYSSETRSGVVGLSQQIMHRLLEARTLCEVLAQVEAKAARPRLWGAKPPVVAPNSDALATLWKMRLPFEDEVARRVDAMSAAQARQVFALFDTDRVVASDLYDFFNMLLSTFQYADSTERHSPLEFFMQKEWRLIHHKREGLGWVNLQPPFEGADRSLVLPPDAQRAIRARWLARVTNHGARQRSEPYLQNAWVLAGLDGMPFRDCIAEILAPRRLWQGVTDLVDSLQWRRPPDLVFYDG